MPAQTIKVTPPALLAAAASVSATAEKAAAPSPSAVPHAVPASPADGAWASIAAGMTTQSAQMSAQLAGKGPQLEATTQAGVAQLQANDESNAAQIEAVGHSADDDWFYGEGPQYQAVDPGGAATGPSREGMGPVPHSIVEATGFKTSLGDGWDNETEEEMDAPPGWSMDHHGNWSPPVLPVDGGGAMGGGSGRAPI
jgi:hypothetical protein